MERTKYFNYTRPSQTQLNNTEDSRARSIIRRIDSSCQMGIVSGFITTVNADDATLIDIGPGTGFTGGRYRSNDISGDGSGERISTISNAATGDVTITGQGLADYTAGTINYVSLIYAESESTPLSEITYPFNSHDTIVSEVFTVSVLTAVQWVALTTVELRNRILVALVTAQGAGNALAAANIQQVVQPKSHPTSTQPSNVAGVSIIGISQETLIGSGTLRYTTADKKLYWTAPGDSEGAGITITDSGEYTLYSGDTTYWITVNTIFASLAVGDETDTISIISLYGQVIPRFSAEDTVHRDMLGTGIATVRNPHATSIDDVTGGTFDHADLYHLNGISGDAESDQLECAINAGNDTIEVTNNGGFRNSFLVDGRSYQTLNGIAAGTLGVLAFDILPALDSADYLIYVDSAGALQRVKIAGYTPAAPGDFNVLWDGDIEILDMHNTTAGNGTITWDVTADTLTWSAPGDAAGAAVTILTVGGVYAGIYKVYSNNGIDWIIVEISGILGGDNSSTFAIDKNETTHADESILKLAIVTWSALDDAHGNLRDIRSFRTADTKQELYEEHDEDGRHTKVLQQQLKVYDTVLAVDAQASDSGIRGSVSGDLGIIGSAGSDTGVYGRAAGDIGVYGSAVGKTGVYGKADVVGVYGSAANTGVCGSAGVNVGGYFEAVGNTGVYATAAAIGVYAKVAGDTGVYASVGGNTAGKFYAAGAMGLSAEAIGNTGVYATAAAIGVYAKVAGATGVYGEAGGDYGGFFEAAGDTGVYGTAANYGGYFIAGANSAANIIGVYGQAANAGDADSAIGVYGYVNGVGATGVYGEAAAADGRAGCFSAAGGATALEIIAGAGAAHANSEEELIIKFNGATRYIHLHT